MEVQSLLVLFLEPFRLKKKKLSIQTLLTQSRQSDITVTYLEIFLKNLKYISQW